VARPTPGPRLADVRNPYESREKRKEREAEARKNRKLKWALGGVAALVILLAVLYVTIFSGPRTPSPDTMAAENLKLIEKGIQDRDAALADPNTSAADKATLQREKKELEKRRDELKGQAKK